MPTGGSNNQSVRIVIDTNVIVSAFLTPHGIAMNILHHVLAGTVTLITSPSLFDELEEVLQRQKFDRPILERRRLEFIRFIERHTEVVFPDAPIDKITSDTDDNRVLEAAVAGKADYIVTGDKKHLLPLKKFRGVTIVSPRDFLAELLEHYLG